MNTARYKTINKSYEELIKQKLKGYLVPLYWSKQNEIFITPCDSGNEKQLYINVKDLKIKPKNNSYFNGSLQEDNIPNIGYKLKTGFYEENGEVKPGITVLDLDKHGGKYIDGTEINGIKSLFENIVPTLSKEAQETMKNTLMVITPSGGLHLYFNTPSEFKGINLGTGVNMFAEYEENGMVKNGGIDLRSTNQNINVFGAIKPVNGVCKEYKVSNPKAEVKDMPKELIEIILTYIKDLKSNKSSVCSVSGLGGRNCEINKELYSYCINHKIFDKNVITFIGNGLNNSISNPLEERELKGIINSVYVSLNNKAIKYIDCIDTYEAFYRYVEGDLYSVINSEDKAFKYIYWNSKQWLKLSEEETSFLWGNLKEELEREYNIKLQEIENIDFEKQGERNKAVRSIQSIYRNLRRVKVKDILQDFKSYKKYQYNIKEHEEDSSIIATKNGKIVNFKTGEIKESQKEDFVLNTFPFNLVDKEEANNFAFEYVIDDYSSRINSDDLHWLLDFVAYKLMGGKSLNKCIGLIGRGRSGKNVFTRIIQDILGEKAVNFKRQYLLSTHNQADGRDDLIPLLNDASIGITSEFNEDEIINSSTLKQLTGGDTRLQARATMKASSESDLSNLDIMITTNNSFKFSQVDDAIIKRLALINVYGYVEKEIEGYYDKVFKPNIDLMFTFFVYRALDLKKRLEEKHITFLSTIPENIKNYTKHYLMEVDSLSLFAYKYLDPKEEGECLLIDFANTYKDACIDEGFTPVVEIDVLTDNDKLRAKECNKLVALVKKIPGYEGIESKRTTREKTKTWIVRGVELKKLINID